MRARRFASFALDLFLGCAPWGSMLGLALGPASRGYGGLGAALVFAVLAALGTLIIVLINAVTFTRFGRTLGMTAVGLVAARGSRAGALALTLLVALVPFGGAVLASSFVSGDAMKILAPTAPLAGLAVNMVFALGPTGRTLADRIAGIYFARDDGPPPLQTRGAPLVDWLLALAVGAPMPLALLDRSDFGAGAVGGACAVAVVVALQIALRASGGSTLGQRAIRSRTPL